MPETQTIKLTDGSELVSFEKEEKEKLEAEILIVLDKYSAVYMPVIQEEKSLTQITQRATLFLLKKKGIPSTDAEVNPLIDAEPEPKTEEAPKVD